MNKLLQAVKSKTAWTAVALYLLNNAPTIKTLIPDKYKPAVDAVLTILVVVFHIFPSQNYQTPPAV